jgi:glycosyltransferase involved in cell wall biosynthesis
MGRTKKHQVKPGILYLINDLQAGGAEMFLKRLGEGLSPHYQPWIGILSPERNSAEFRRFFFDSGFWKETSLYQFKKDSWADWAYWKANAVGKRFGVENVYLRLRQHHERKGWQTWLKQKNIVLVSSSSTATDSFVAKRIKAHIDLPWVITQHSSYNQVGWARQGSEKEFIRHANLVLCQADAILFTAEDNKAIYPHLNLSSKTQIKKVYLGYEPQSKVPEKPLKTQPLKLAMMARGIPEKGWEQALQAVEILNADNIQVELQAIYSPSDYMDSLQDQYAHVQGVFWRGYVSNPAPILAEAHASLLPSYFQESLPYAVTESLAYGTPVICLPVAEIPSMLKTDLGLAGQLLDSDSNGKANIQSLVNAIQLYRNNPKECKEHSALARLAFAKKFSMQTCLQEYKAVFDALTQKANS